MFFLINSVILLIECWISWIVVFWGIEWMLILFIWKKKEKGNVLKKLFIFKLKLLFKKVMFYLNVMLVMKFYCLFVVFMCGF